MNPRRLRPTRNRSTAAPLESYYLEDSYVLAIKDHTPGELVFRMELVLTKQHPDYQAPRPGEQYCYARGRLRFRQVTRIEWISRDERVFTDAHGDEDLGNIDFLQRTDDERWRLGGDWGEVLVHTPTTPEVELDPSNTDPPHGTD